MEAHIGSHDFLRSSLSCGRFEVSVALSTAGTREAKTWLLHWTDMKIQDSKVVAPSAA